MIERTKLKPSQPAMSACSAVLQRKRACGETPGPSGECEECRKKRLQRKIRNPKSEIGNDSSVPAIVHEVLSSPGQLLDPPTRTFMEPRFGHDFSQVRVHTDARAADSARAVDALAYTVGRDVVFAQERFRPSTTDGRQLLAHELTHVVQQGSCRNQPRLGELALDPADSPLEGEARRIGANVLARSPGITGRAGPAPILSRADPEAVGYTMRVGQSARTGIQFFPTNVTDTRVGPVTVQGGLLSGGASRLNVIIGENLTLRTLARQLLPLWTTATPFTPPGAAAPLPLDIITADELAQGLLVYNQYYLPVPAMTAWRSGLRFPLPVEIDEATGVATLHPLQIRALAGAFDPVWMPLLDLRAPAVVAPPAATLQADVTAFLARETTALARGIHLGARAVTNAVAELPFMRATFRQLGAGAFDVALALIDNLLERDVRLLAAQRDGAGILIEIANALAAGPQPLTASQQASFDRANLAIAVAPQLAPPTAARNRAEKTVTLDTLKLDGSTHNPATDVRVADAIYSQCNVHVTHGVDATATNPQTIALIGDTDLRSANNCQGPSAEETALFRNGSATFGMAARFRAYFVATVSGIDASGYSCIAADAPAPLFRNKIVVENSGDDATLAHELAHILRNSGTHPAGTVAGGRPAAPAERMPLLTDAQCTAIYNNA
jgi:hypothetical protein